MDVTIYHNPSCGASRHALEMIRNAGIEPTVIEYLKTPPSRQQLTNMIEDAGLTVRAVLSTWPPLGAKANLFRVSTRKAARRIVSVARISECRGANIRFPEA